MKKLTPILFIIFTLFLVPLFSQEASPAATAGNPAGLTTQVMVLAGLALLPFAIMLLTSYVKVVVVLALLRNALGVQQTPPNQVLNGIALMVTLYVMSPTGFAMYEASKDYMIKHEPEKLLSGPSAIYLLNVASKAKEPLKDFLRRNCQPKQINAFYNLAYKSFPDPIKKSIKPTDFIILLPSFITSQLKSAFEIGVLIYLPFFVIDIVTSNILLSMGMMMLSPLSISLPLKLMLIVVLDGWSLILQGLTLSFR